ncbi:MAG: hypothetical protein IH956_01400 [Chloroflexi bacterium]|nr:hypothetical protein [Chloroflexota bacterium]
MHHLKFGSIITLVLFAMLLMACEGSAQTQEEALTQRAEAFAKVMGKGDWLGAHKFFSPRYREICASGQFAISTGLSMNFLKGFLGIAEGEQLTFSVTSVTVDGDEGRVFSDIHRNGELIDFGGEDEGGRWVYVAGEWWSEDEDWEDGCDPNKIFE